MCTPKKTKMKHFSPRDVERGYFSILYFMFIHYKLSLVIYIFKFYDSNNLFIVEMRTYFLIRFLKTHYRSCKIISLSIHSAHLFIYYQLIGNANKYTEKV